MNSDALVVLTTCPDETTAAKLASELILAGLAACVSRLPGLQSTYRWEGQLRDEPEVLLIIKTLADRYPTLEMRLKSLHPYELPEIIALPAAEIFAPYLAWLRMATHEQTD